MKKRVLIAAVGAISLGFWYGLHRGAPPPSNSSKPQKSLSALRAEIPLPARRAQDLPKINVPRECQKSWGAILAQSQMDWFESLAEQRIPVEPLCQAWERAHIPPTWGGFPPAKCFDPRHMRTFLEIGLDPSPDKEQSPRFKQNAQCLQALVFYRCWVIAQATRDLPADTLSATVLSSKIMARFFEMGSDPKALADVREWNALLKKQDPDMYASYKLDLILEFAAEPTSPRGVENALEEIRRRFSVQDPELAAVDLVDHLRKKEKEGLAEKIEEAAEKYPQDGRWDYYRGYLSWENRDRAKTIQYIQRALRLDPENPEYKKTLTSVQTAPLGTGKLFALTLGMRFDQL